MIRSGETNSMRGYAYHWIKSKILRNEISSRRSLNEKLMGEQLNLSRTPIREALIMLEVEGHLIREEGRGFFIRQFSMKDIDDMFEYRELLECAVVDIMISRISEKDISDLNRLLLEIESIIADDRSTDALVKGNEFHMRCIEICGNSMMTDELHRCYERIALIAWSCQNSSTSAKSHEEHKAILSALKEKNPDKLRHTIIDHNKNSKERVITLLRQDSSKWHFGP